MFIHEISKPGRRLALMMILWLTVSACAAESPADGGSSPEEVYERLRSAISNQDFAEVVQCMEPDKRPLLSMSMFIGATMIVALTSTMGEAMAEMTGSFASSLAEGLAEGFGDELAEEERQKLAEQTTAIKEEAKNSTVDLEAQLQAVLDKHGVGHLSDENAELDITGDFSHVANEVFADVDHGAFVADLLSIMDDAGQGEDGFSAKYPDANLTDVLVVGQRATGKAGDEEIEFTRIDGRWYLTFNLD